MMEKRNFVTSARTSMEGAAEIDGIIAAGEGVFAARKRSPERGRSPEAERFEKLSSAEDERTDSGEGA